MAESTDTARFDFTFDPRYRFVGRLLGVTPASACVKVGASHLTARFGPWTVRTPLSNIADAKITGPYSLAKTIGPAHLSFGDQGLTFATNPDRGVCLTFLAPVTGMDPLGLLRHPGLTVTVSDPEALVEALNNVDGQPEPALTSVPAERIEELEEERVEQAAEDHLHLMTASALRSLADDRGVAHTSRMKKSELVDLLDVNPADDLVEVIEAHGD